MNEAPDQSRARRGTQTDRGRSRGGRWRTVHILLVCILALLLAGTAVASGDALSTVERNNIASTNLTANTVDSVRAPPTVEISITPDPAKQFETVTVDASDSSHPDGILRCEFDFESDGTFDAAATDCVARTSFDDTGVFETTVLVIANSEETARDSATVEIVALQPPIAEFAVSPETPRPGETVTLDGSASSDPDGRIIAYEWRVDGDFLAQGQIVQTALDSGDHDISLEVTDDDERQSATTRTISVRPNTPPQIDVVFDPTEPQVGEVVTFDASASFDPDGEIVTYEWLFGDDTGTTTSDPIVTHTYDEAGRYGILARVIDDEGAAAADEFSVTVTSAPAPPTAVCSVFPTDVEPGQSVTIDASDSQNASFARFDVDGDGVYESLVSGELVFTTSYPQAGTYRPLVTGINDGMEDTAECGTVVVGQNQPPVASFTFSPTTPTAGGLVTFDASASSDPDGTIQTYRWDFDGDGSLDLVSTDPVVDTTFPASGTFQPRLTVLDDDEAAGQTDRTVTVDPEQPAPIAVCSVEQSVVETGDLVTIDASESVNTASVGVDVDGDEQVDIVDETDFVVTHRYESPGTYTILVQARSGDQSDWSFCGEVTVVEVTTTQPPTTAVPPPVVVTTDTPTTVFTTTTQAPTTTDVPGTVTPAPTTTTDQQDGEPLIPAFDLPQLPEIDIDGFLDSLPPGETILIGLAVGIGLLLLLALLALWWFVRWLRSLFGRFEPSAVGVEQYTAGTVGLPDESGRIGVDCGFKPDLVVFTASNDTRTDGGIDRSAGWTYGAAGRADDGWSQFATSVADDTQRLDAASCAFTDEAAIQVLQHGETAEGDPDVGSIRASLAGTNRNGFVLDVDVDRPDTDGMGLSVDDGGVTGAAADGGTAEADGGVEVQYRAYQTGSDIDAAVGHFQTPNKPGTVTLDLGIDADYLELYAGSAIETEGIATGQKAVACSVGTVVDGPETDHDETSDVQTGSALIPDGAKDAPQQVVHGGTVSPTRGNTATNTAQVGAIALLFATAEKVVGRTTAHVTALGSKCKIHFEEVYRGTAKTGGKKDTHPVGYVALHAKKGRHPVLAAVPFPENGTQRSLDLGVRPGMVDVTAAGVDSLGAEQPDSTATALGWSEGVAIAESSGVGRQFAVGGGLTRVHGRSGSGSVARTLSSTDGVASGRRDVRLTSFADGRLVLAGSALQSGEESAAESSLLTMVVWPAAGRIKRGS